MLNKNPSVAPQKSDDKTPADGLPDIANPATKNPWVFALLGIFIVMMLIFYFSRHPDKDGNAKTTDETFSVDSANAPPLTRLQVAKLKAAMQSALPSPSNDAQKAMLDRIRAPIMIVNTNGAATNSNAAALTNDGNNHPNKTALDPNTQFLNQASGQNVASENASLLQHRDQLIAQGNLIHAVLESAINSDLPGTIRAVVSEPVYSEDGSQVLITPGSRLIGQYKSGMLTGQSRVFVAWTRLIEPNGISIMLGSPGVDNLGVAGLAADEIDHHFWQMFGTATLLSLLGAGASNVGISSGDQYNASQAYRQAISQSLAQSSNNSLQQNITIPPTLVINQGKPIMVFVAKDLNFGTALKKANAKINVF